MTYQSYDPRNAQGNAHQAQFEKQYTQNQVSFPPSKGYLPSVQKSQGLNSGLDPRYAPVGASYQHRPPTKPHQNHHDAPQKAYAVAVPSPQPTSTNVGRFTNSNAPQSAHPIVPQGSLSARNSSSIKPESQPGYSEPPLDYQLLLLSLAEEYFAAAYGYGSIPGLLQREKDISEYYQLIATGLGCLEAVLSRFRLDPEREATVRLRYATILFEKTENTMEAEEALSKGVSLCDRHRFFDLKYNMQHLLAGILFQKHSRAAFKFLDGIIRDVEAYQHVAWLYAFRFLKVSLHLELSTHQDTMSALTQLRQIVNISTDYGDKSIVALATTVEALTCLRNSSDADSIEQAQRALATVRSLQLDPAVGQLHQVKILVSIVDLSCHLHQFDPVQALAKMQTMENELRKADEGKPWASDGSFAIPVANARMPACNSRSGVVRIEENGSLVIIFNWISIDDVNNLGYLLSGIAMAYRNTTDGQKSEHMLEEGIKNIENMHREISKLSSPKSIVLASALQLWREQMTSYMRLHLAFTQCARTSWSSAKQQQLMIQTIVRSINTAIGPAPQPLLLLSAYLEAVIQHGTGNLDQALNIYQSDICSIHTYRKTPHPSRLHLDVVLLAALNSILIIRNPTHPQHHQLPSLLSFLEHLCIRNPNRQIQSAYRLLTATTNPSSTILMTKQSLQFALQTAKQSENNQLMCIVLNLMSWKFFRGVVGDQAQKSAQASQSLAQKCMDSLWMSVAAGVLGDTLEAAGRIEDANRARESGLLTARTLPEALQVAMRTKNEGQDDSSVS